MSTMALARDRAFAWRDEQTWSMRLVLAGAMAIVTGLTAQVALPLPFTPVPVTGQVFAVLMAGVLLGGSWGGVSQALYVCLGALGLSWFNGWTGGPAALAGPTGGYLIGFTPAAIFIGYATSRPSIRRRLLPTFGVMMVGVAIIYFFGALHLHWWLGRDMGRTFLLGVAPFVAVDVVKAFAAAAIGVKLLPQKA